MATYNSVHITRHIIIALGRSRCGFLHSSAVVDIELNPKKAKNTAATEPITPEILYGINDVQFSGLTNNTPPAVTAQATPTFIATIILLARCDSLIPTYTDHVTNTVTKPAGRSRMTGTSPILGADK